MATAKNGKVDVDGYRARIADAVGMAVGELIAARRNDPRAALLRQVAAYFLAQQDRLEVDEIAKILDAPEQWVRDSIAYIERRKFHYYAFSVYLERVAATYELASRGTAQPIGKTAASGIDVNLYRQRAAAAAGVTAAELVAASGDDPDAETVQKVAAYLLLSRDRLEVGDVARILCRSEQWARASNDYVERQVKRSGELRTFVERATATYARASS
jgi:chromosome segregation and condensation protein ScpB